MSMAATIAPHLPYLRRFARALTGDQTSGDAYVAATLEAIIADPSILPDTAKPKLALYRLMVSLWDSLPVNEATDTAIRPEERNLNALTPRSRQAFLLSTIEEFRRDEVADILNTDESGVEQLIELAGREIAEQVATDVLIIEDEAMIAMDIEALVEDLGHGVTDIARTREEAVAAGRKQQPGLILADIHLADGSSGIDAVNDMLKEFNVPVIFVTAYPERLLTGERPEPAFLITKPFQPDMLRAVISQALFFDRKAGNAPKNAA